MAALASLFNSHSGFRTYDGVDTDTLEEPVSHRIALVVVPSLALTALAGAQQQPAHQPTTKTTKQSTPAISRDSAKTIALAHVKGATVSSEQLHTRNGHKYYVMDLKEPGHQGVVRATVDASTGAFTRLDQTSHSSTNPPSGATHPTKP